jgi:phosphate transport system substrate-binding protein
LQIQQEIILIDDPAKAKALKELIRWGVTEGQKFSQDLGYVPLSPDVAQKVEAAVDQIKP